MSMTIGSFIIRNIISAIIPLITDAIADIIKYHAIIHTGVCNGCLGSCFGFCVLCLGIGIFFSQNGHSVTSYPARRSGRSNDSRQWMHVVFMFQVYSIGVSRVNCSEVCLLALVPPSRAACGRLCGY